MKLLLTILTFFLTTVLFTFPVNAQVETATASPVMIEYTLPYPGILPDHPMYIFKQIRDWVMDKLIMDPVKKAEFYVLQGDKRLAMGMMLATSGKVVLAEQTISKGEKYMHQAVQSLLTVKESGQAVPGYILDRLTTALAKHAEVIEGEVAKAAEAQKTGLTASLTLVTQLEKDLLQLK